MKGEETVLSTEDTRHETSRENAQLREDVTTNL